MVNIDKGRFSYRLLAQSRAPQAIECLCSVFCASEPICLALKISPSELKPFVTDLVGHVVDNGLSWVAIDMASSRVIGVRILSDLHQDFMPPDYQNEKLTAVFNMFNSLYENQQHELDADKTTVLHCWLVAVLPEFQRQGVLRDLFRIGSTFAFDQGFKFGIEEATNRYNADFLEKEVSVTKLNTIRYDQYELNDKRPFLAVEGTKECVLCKYPLSHMEV